MTQIYSVFHSKVFLHGYRLCLSDDIVCMYIQTGYRHLDTAKVYGSEPALGNALREAIFDGVIEREDIFVTSKLWESDHNDPISALKQSLQKLGMEYEDMYLVHWTVKLKPTGHGKDMVWDGEMPGNGLVSLSKRAVP
ncbi:aldose reductase-like [Olea europaea var. sylvestris]|uniref:aldose reductase-like n=1 Tax=Olea europaea var. sylvestris TaxID=158386 RepID=UPI000C1D416B|nr:aldose reductase-like [Olea europaea var. sylvestris]